MISIYNFYLLFIAIINILITHSLLTRKKSIKYSVFAFILVTLFIFFTNIYAKEYIQDRMIIEYALYFNSFLYLLYIHIVFEESITKKIFATFSIWMFSTICLVISISAVELFLVSHDVPYLNLIYLVRICIQILLLLAIYFFISKHYKMVLNRVSNETIRFMSLYPILAFILLINNYTISFELLKIFTSTSNMFLLLVFIILGYVLVFAGISSAAKIISLQYNLEKMEWASKTDSLTGLYNRRYIIERIDNESISYKRSKKKFSLIIADIDFFKRINDTFGHDCGDRVLKVVSKSLKDAVREQDFVSRWGGEEFLILLPETEIEGAFILADRIRKIIEEQIFEYNGVQVPITMTFGVTVNVNYERIEDTIIKADNALYEGKSGGRNCVIVA